MSWEAGILTIARTSGLVWIHSSKLLFCMWKTTGTRLASACSAPQSPKVGLTQSCLGAQTEYNCSQVADLRLARGITAPVLYVEEAALTSTPSDAVSSNPPPAAEEEEDLLELQPSELVTILQKLRVELSKKTKSSASTKVSPKISSIASSARPNIIDKEGHHHVTSSQETQAWWISSNPQPLHYTTSALPPGPNPPGPDQSSPNPTSLDVTGSDQPGPSPPGFEATGPHQTVCSTWPRPAWPQPAWSCSAWPRPATSQPVEPQSLDPDSDS
ncbi:hypothetical protein GWK47_001612 [Chionoecetes opilio]|uniref:Uncharacterized protein n=1 Tax=Chionoecetes opilio TaxID=41210 RepID=A0A8J4XX45_CHIOP|nr:hypothetical protein GWK47_001612 [Chionoecetes opilio]